MEGGLGRDSPDSDTSPVGATLASNLTIAHDGATLLDLPVATER